MPNIRHEYFLGDEITFRGEFKVDNVAQTPDASSGKAQVMKEGTATAIVAETTADIAGTQIQYKHIPAAIGQYALFFSATFNSGADKRTGVIEFMVRSKEAH